MALSVAGSFRIATALRAALKNYTLRTLKDDFIAGLVVSLVALPLSMALSIAVGLPPQHGLYTAIVAGVVTALLGGSMTQVSGPTAAFIVILAPIVSDMGLHGLIWCQILAGILLIILGTARLGKLVTYVPHPVVTGFTTGIAVVIGTLALNDFFGLGITQLKGDYIQKLGLLASHASDMKPQELAVGLVTLLTIIFFGKVTTKIPSPIVGITLGALLSLALNKTGFPVDTLATRFSYETAEGIKHGIPPYPPVFHLPTFAADTLFSVPDYAGFKKLLGPAVMVAALAALESLLSATVGDRMTKIKHDPDAELNGLGIANILSGLVAGIPATGAIARTATNIHAGAKTPLASAFHALLIMIYVLTLSPLINHTPMAALAALLLMVSWRMSDIGEFTRILRHTSRRDAVILLGCFLPTVFVDMVAGVSTGMALATIFYMEQKHINRKERL